MTTEQRPGGTRVLPTGTVTFLFTDIEGSTRLVQELGDARYPRGARRSRPGSWRAPRAPRAASCSGPRAMRTFVAFAGAVPAIRAAAEAQRRWQRRAGRTGDPSGCGWASTPARRSPRERRLPGPRRSTASPGSRPPDTVARSSSPTPPRALAADALPDGLELRDLGEHRLKDLARPERLHQLVGPGLRATFPPLRTLERAPNNLPTQLTSFVGRARGRPRRGACSPGPGCSR